MSSQLQNSFQRKSWDYVCGLNKNRLQGFANHVDPIFNHHIGVWFHTDKNISLSFINLYLYIYLHPKFKSLQKKKRKTLDTNVPSLTVPEPLMKACLHHRAHQVLNSSVTSNSLIGVKLWPPSVVTQRCPGLQNKKTRWRMVGGGAERGGCYADVLTLRDCQWDSCCCKCTHLCDMQWWRRATFITDEGRDHPPAVNLALNSHSHSDEG